MNKKIVTVDIGGTGLKLAFFEQSGTILSVLNHRKIPSFLKSGISNADFMELIVSEIVELIAGADVSAIGISSAGIVDYAGTKVLAGMDYLAPLKSDSFIKTLSEYFCCPVSLINDCDSALLGAAYKGYLQGSGCVGVMAIGTGVGFSLWKNGRKWLPNRNLPLLGAISTESGCYDQLISASLLEGRSSEKSIISIFTEQKYQHVREDYLAKLASVIRTAAIIYDVDQILIGGGLADAINLTDFEFEEAIAEKLISADDFFKVPTVKLMTEGNQLQLLGAARLALGESFAAPARFNGNFSDQATEKVSKEKIFLEEMKPIEVVRRSLNLENEAGELLLNSADAIADVAEIVADKFKLGGRLIYVGSGTSGRVAAMDAVELNCTYGLPKDQSLTLISGGLTEASISIEENFEEDASAVPDLLALNPTENDVVIGISASGTAYYVRSALACAKSLGCETVLVSVSEPTDYKFFNKHIALHSGSEIVTGSTRMKAGTATKKVINAISTTAMVLSGKVFGTYMIDMSCLNKKLEHRAVKILQGGFGISEEEALSYLQESDFVLSDAVNKLKSLSR